MAELMSSRDTVKARCRKLVKMRDGEAVAQKIARRWQLNHRHDEILLNDMTNHY